MISKRFYYPFILLSFVFTTTLAQSPLSLNGEWKFKTIPNNITDVTYLESDSVKWDTLTVPGNWDVENRYSDYVGKACYYKVFSLPDNFKNKRLILHFDAVYETAEIYLNGRKIGGHVGGYTPFEFDITGNVKSQNRLLIIANNTTKRGAWWAWSGVSRSVEILKVQPQRIIFQHITAIPNLKTNEVQINLSYKIENLTDITDYVLSYQILNKNNKKVYKGENKVLLKPNDTTIVNISFKLKPGLLKLWNFDNPVLYQLNSTLSSNSNLSTITDDFGVRLVEIKGTKFYLNGEAIRVNGLNRIHDHRAYGNTEPISLIQQDILNIKSLGGSMARLMHSPQSPELLDFCDRVGFLLISEIPVWGKMDPNAYTDSPLAKQWLKEMIERDYNHPSIIGWSVGNELSNDESDYRKRCMTSEQNNYVRSMVKYVKTELDSTHLITYVSYTAFRDIVNDTNEPADCLDFISVNCYGKADKQIRAVHKKWSNKPIFVSEFGRNQIGTSLNSTLSKDLQTDYDSIAKLPYIIGTSLWAYNDYRSNYEGSTTSQNRGWGVVNEWRQKKRAFFELQKLYAPVKDIKIEKNNNLLTITIQPKEKNGLPNYILKNYVLRVKQVDNQGKTILEWIKKLPKISSGDKKMEFSTKLKNATTRCSLDVISPANVVVDESHIDFSVPPVPEITRIEMGLDGFRIFFNRNIFTDQYIVYLGSKQEEIYTDYFEMKFGENNILPNEIKIAAVNSYGKSSIITLKIKQSNSPLPPMLWHLEAANKSIIIGYQTLKDDEKYIVSYLKKGNKSQEQQIEIPAKFAGSYKLDNLSKGTYQIKMKRISTNGKSDWSRTLSIEVK